MRMYGLDLAGVAWKDDSQLNKNDAHHNYISNLSGSTLKDVQPLGEVPLWIIHGTADRAVSVNESKKVVSALERAHNDKRLRYDWWKGANHGAPARLFYHKNTYEWLFSHCLTDRNRPVRRDINITQADLRGVYRDMPRNIPKPEEIDWHEVKDEENE